MLGRNFGAHESASLDELMSSRLSKRPYPKVHVHDLRSDVFRYRVLESHGGG